MFKQTTTFLLVVLLATQAFSSHINRGKYSKALQTMKEQAQQQLEILRTVVNGEVASANHDLENLRQQTNNYRNDVLDDGRRKIEAEAQQQLDNFNVIKNLAESSGNDIDVCLYQFEGPIENLSKYVVNELDKCLSNQMNELDVAIRHSKGNIADLSNQVGEIEAELTACRDNDVNCIAPIVLRIQNAQAEIPAQIGVETDRVKPIIESLQVAMDHCSSSKVAECTSLGNQIVKDFEKCVYGELFHKKIVD